jgi:hypothetical protein
MLGLNQALLRLWHWQSGALPTRLDPIHTRKCLISSVILLSNYFFIWKNVITEESQEIKVERAACWVLENARIYKFFGIRIKQTFLEGICLFFWIFCYGFNTPDCKNSVSLILTRLIFYFVEVSIKNKSMCAF